MSNPDAANTGSESTCPSCGRFVGAQTVCPYCGARVHKRLSLRVARYGAVALALLGLIALWWAARHADVPEIHVQDVAHTMNWAYVRMSGTVIRYPTYDEQSGYLKFRLYDGTGEIMVAAYRNESRALIADGKVPSVGDRVAVEGTLKVGQDWQSLIINVPANVVVERPSPTPVEIGDLDTGWVYRKVRVRGQVRALRVPYEGLTVVNVRDRTGAIDVVYTADLVHLSGEPPAVVPGDSVQVDGAVTLYGESLQLSLDGAGGLVTLATEVPISWPRSAAEISSADVGRMVRIEGTVRSARRMEAGYKLTLADDTGEVVVVLWQNVLSDKPQDVELRRGIRIAVRGLVSEYRGQLEIVPELPVDVWWPAVQAMPSPSPTPRPTATPTWTVRPTDTPSPTFTPGLPTPTSAPPTPTTSPTPTISPTPTPIPPTSTPAVLTLSTGSVTKAQLGQVVTVQGQIITARQYSGGRKCYLDDGSGQLAVWLPAELYSRLPDAAGWVAGSVARVTGTVQEYKGELEIVPRDTADARLTLVVTPTPVSLVRIGDITADDVGRQVAVEGQVVEASEFSKGFKYLLDDGSGRIVLLLWRNVYDAVANKEGLAIGATVRVIGKVEEYKGTLEIVPASGADVTIK